MAYKCLSCGMNISEHSYICSGCGKVCKEKVVKLSGKNTIDVNKATPADNRGHRHPAGENASVKPVGGSAKETEKQNIVYSKNALDGVKSQNTIDINKKSDFDFSKNDYLGPSIDIGGKNSMFNIDELKLDEYQQKTASHNQKDQRPAKAAPSGGNYDAGAGYDLNLVNVAYKSGKTGGGGSARSGGRRPLSSDGFLINKIISANKAFINSSSMAYFDNLKTPNYKLAVLCCACPSMTAAVENAMGLGPGDAYMIKVLGSSTIENLTSEVMRSLVVGVHMFGVEEIIVLSHDDCVLKQLSSANLIDAMRKNDIRRTDIEINDIKAFGGGFSNCKQNIRKTIAFIHGSKLIPETVAVHGMMITPKSLKLEVVVDGYSERIVV